MRDRLAAALLAALVAGPCAAAELGTLFHTPQERERLDRLRRGEPVNVVDGDEAASTAPRVTGYVKRSDGRDTVFLDGRAYPASGTRASPLMQPKAVSTPGGTLPESAVRVETKPKG